MISLLPPELKKKRLAEKRQGAILTGVTVVVLLAILAYGALFTISIFLRNDLRTLRNQREAVEREAAALEEYAQLHEELTDAEALVSKALGTVPPWSDMLHEIGLTLPTGVWLSEVTARYAGDSGDLTLRGWGYEHDDVAAMLDRIYTLDTLDNILCRVSGETRYAGQTVVQFTVNARVKTGPAFIALAEGGS